MKFLLALSPIVFVLVGIMAFKKPTQKVAPLALLYTILLAFTYFNTNMLSFDEIVGYIDPLLWKGIKEGAKIIFMLLGSFIMLEIMKQSGAMDVIKKSLVRLTSDRRAQLVIVGMMVPIFLEGAAGAGSPAAISAPFLVGLGFDPIVAVTVALLGDATPCSWGGAGLTTITGGKFLVDTGIATTAMNSAMVGRIHMFGVLIIPFLIILLAFGRKGFKGVIPYLLYSGITTMMVMFILSNFIGPEITSMGTGIISIILNSVYLKYIGIKSEPEYIFENNENIEANKISPLRAFSPYLIMLLLLPIVRYTFPWAVLTKFGYIMWVDCVIFLCAILGGLILRVSFKSFIDIMNSTVKRIFPVLITMGSLLTVAYIMQSNNTGMIQTIANTFSNVGLLYPAAAVLIGSTGAFVTGTGLGSNIMFAPLHVDTSMMLNINSVTVFAGQNAGASLGNLICPNNTVAACASVDSIGSERKVMKKSLLAFSILLLVYMALTMLYTFVLFSNYHL